MPKEGAQAATGGSKMFFDDRILAETIRKELRLPKRYGQYMLTPSMTKNLVITQKPSTTTPTALFDDKLVDEGYLRQVQLSNKIPKERYPYPMTTSQEYGWDSQPLLQVVDRRFHFPRHQSEITKEYAMVLGSKKGIAKKD